MDSFGSFSFDDADELVGGGSRGAGHCPLELSREEVADAFRTARLGVWHWRVGTQELLWSEEAFRIAGVDPLTFPRTVDAAMANVHPDDRAATLARLLGAADQHVADACEFRLVRPDGGIRHCWVRIKPVPQGAGQMAIQGILLDITEQRAVEARLAASEAHYRAALALNPQIPWTADPDGKVTEVGDSWHELIDAPGGSWAEAIHPDDLTAVVPVWTACLASGDAFDMRYRLRQRAGGYRWFRGRAIARRDDSGAVAHWYGFAEDIDEQVCAEDTNRLREEWLLNAHEAAGLGLFEIDIVRGLARMSPQSLIMHGLPPETFREFRDWEEWGRLIHPDDMARARDAARRAIATGGFYDVVFRVPQADGSTRWINGLGRVEYDAAGAPSRLLGINLDVTARRTAELRLEESEALNRTIVDSSPDSIKLLSADGHVLFANDGSGVGLELGGTSGLIGRAWPTLWPEAARARVVQALDAARRGSVGRFTAARATALGTPKWWDVVMSPVLGEDGVVQRIVAISRDITQQKQAEERFLWSATHDPLTHLPNRRLFEERLTSAIEEAGVSGRQVGLLAIDLDNLKLINDALGHDAGNAALRTLADRLTEVIGADATAARLGGDEFAVVLPRISGAADAEAVARAILARLKEPFSYNGHALDCRASIGASLYPCDGLDASELLKQADLALYSSKAQRGGLQMFEPRMRAELQQRVSMVHLARDALAEDRLLAFFQPKVALADGRIAGFEALARLRDRDGQLHLPATIAAAFEDGDLAVAITDRVVDLSVAAMRRWQEAGLEFGHVAINAAAADFRRRDFSDWLLARLDAAGVSPHLLQLEVTETVFLGRGADFVEGALRRLRAAGVTIALDDFGTGYASLSHLKQFPVDIIKIDKSFVADMDADRDDAAIVEAIVNLGRALRIEVVAEGVETAIQAAHLKALGCRYGQGFLYGQAIPPDEIPALLAAR